MRKRKNTILSQPFDHAAFKAAVLPGLQTQVSEGREESLQLLAAINAESARVRAAILAGEYRVRENFTHLAYELAKATGNAATAQDQITEIEAYSPGEDATNAETLSVSQEKR